MEPPLDESIWRRGWNDTKVRWHQWQFLLLQAALAPSIGLVTGWVTAAPGIGAAAGMLVVVLGLMSVWIGATVLAPLKQRNEARQQISTKDAINLEVIVGSHSTSAVGGDLQGKVWIRSVSVTMTNHSTFLPIGLSAVWLEVAYGDQSHKLSPISSAHRESMKTYMGLPMPSKELAETVYLQPMQSESGEYQFLEHDFAGTAEIFGVRDSTGKLYEHQFLATRTPDIE